MRGYDVKLSSSEGVQFLSLTKSNKARRDTAFRNVVEFLMREFRECRTDTPTWKLSQYALGEFKKENSNKPNEGLKREEIVGLFGELYFIENYLLNKGKSGKKVLEIWKGWDYGAQDFVDRGWIVEVKTSLARKVSDLWINGMRQLAETPGKDLFLCHIYFDSSRLGKRTLSSMVEQLKAKFADHKLEREFMRRLEDVGYDETLAVDYDHYRFPQSGDATFYEVNRPRFPKIVAMDGEERIKEVKYKVSIADIEDFVVPKVSLKNLFGSPDLGDSRDL